MAAMAESRVLLITGASTGIGAETARQAVERGWRVALGARSEDKLADLAQELGEEKAMPMRCDVTEWEDQERFVAATLDRFGQVDAVFANAGFGAKRGFLEETPEQWRSMVLTNVLGVAYSIRAALPHFKDRNAGHFVVTSSVAGRRALPGSLYSATKHAVTAMGEALRQEVSDTPIKMTLIEPGMVDTPFFDNPVDGGLKADDIARAVVYALDDRPDAYRPGRALHRSRGHGCLLRQRRAAAPP
jgi:NADP-dependent 3-hydroxy acid dehydrogenase YdfG